MEAAIEKGSGGTGRSSGGGQGGYGGFGGGSSRQGATLSVNGSSLPKNVHFQRDQVGLMSTNSVEITSGLQAGEQILIELPAGSTSTSTSSSGFSLGGASGGFGGGGGGYGGGGRSGSSGGGGRG